MQCPECGEVSNGRLRYCESCGAKMPETPAMATGSRPALRPSRPSRAAEEPAYTHEILDEVEELSRPYVAAPGLDPEEKTDPGQEPRPPYEGPKWLEHVPAHSPSVVGVGLIAFALVLSILPFFSNAGVLGSLLGLVACVSLVARELREAAVAPGFTRLVPQVLMRAEAAALSAVVLAAIAVSMLSLGFLPLLWVAGAGLILHDQWHKVMAGPEGVAQFYFEPRQLLRMPDVAALAGVALCLLTLFGPWAVQRMQSPVPDNAPVPGGPPELRVINTPRPSDDVLYTRGGEVASLSGWDLPGSLVMELALLAALALMVLHPDLERPSWLRYVPAGAVGLCLVWAVVHIRVSPGPLLFIVGLGAVGSVAIRPFLPPPRTAQPEPEPYYGDDEAG